MKWDGIRVIAGTHRGQLRMRTRQGNDVPPSRFPELASLPDDFDGLTLDGELTVFDGQMPDFGAVISRLRARPGRAWAEPATVIVFDVLHLDGVDLRGSPYIERRAILEGLELPPLWLVPPTFSDGPAAVKASLEHGLEGVVAKRLTSKYVSRRSRAWIKHRHEGIVDAVVIGWRRTSAGGLSLLLAEQGPGGLVHTGRCTAPSSLRKCSHRWQCRRRRFPSPLLPLVCSGFARSCRSR
jgi:bifunctional non-homologous end joining protein LigD